MRRASLLLLAVCAISACTEEGAPPPRTAPLPAVRPAPRETLPEARAVTFRTSDGVTIAATLQPAARPEAPAVILVHQLGSTRAEWAPLLERLHAEPAIATLAIDVRGHGESTAGPDGRALSSRDFSNEEWAAIPRDVEAAAAFLRSEGSAIRPARIGVVGASIGSSAAIVAASGDAALDPIVALSPGRAYHGIDAITPGVQLAGRGFLGVVAEAEADGVETARALARITATEAVVVPGDAHGVRLFDARPELLDRVEAFLRSSLGAERRAR
jgi:pimeloyl-ACP methyl ester carboxylesterase